MVQPQECSIENIFLEHEYIIPIYQRNYAWSKEEIEQLLDDICLLYTSDAADEL